MRPPFYGENMVTQTVKILTPPEKKEFIDLCKKKKTKMATILRAAAINFIKKARRDLGDV